jgi:hypothetical protein
VSPQPAAARTLLANWRGRYTVPAGGLYPHQWSWDSGFNAIGLRHLSPTRAQQELDSLLSAQWTDGRLPQIVFDPARDQDYSPGASFWQSDRLGTTHPPTAGLPARPPRPRRHRSSLPGPPVGKPRQLSPVGCRPGAGSAPGGRRRGSPPRSAARRRHRTPHQHRLPAISLSRRDLPRPPVRRLGRPPLRPRGSWLQRALGPIRTRTR